MESQQYVSEHDKSVELVESLLGFACSSSESKESVNEDVKNEKLDLRSNIILPADCLTAVSMPKNWSQVERLKQQRLMLHQQLFSQKLNVKNDENYIKTLEENFEKIDENGNLIKPKCKTDNRNDPFNDRKAEQNVDSQSTFRSKNGFDEETDSSDIDDDIPRLRISESCTSVENESKDTPNKQENDDIDTDHQLKNDVVAIEMSQDKQEKNSEHVTIDNDHDENISSQNSLNNSDLCDISASKINEALFNTICSVSENKKQEKVRIKEVLNNLKSQAEVKENDHERLSYKIEKPIASAARMLRSPNCISVKSNINCSMTKHFPDSNLKVVKNSTDIASLSPTQYVGLPVDVKSLSEKYSGYTERKENLSSLGVKRMETTIIDKDKDSGSITEQTKEPDYRNIAMQKMLAYKRLVNMNTNEMDAKHNMKEKTLSISIENINENVQNSQSQANCKYSIDMKENLESVNQGINSVPTLQSKHSPKLEEMCTLKSEVLNKRIQAAKIGSCKRVLNAEQKLFEAKKKMLQAELEFSEHKLEMAKKGYFFPKHRIYQRYRLPLKVAADDSTDTDEELIENVNSNSENSISPNRTHSATENAVSLGKSQLSNDINTSPNEAKSANKIVSVETKDHFDQPNTECKVEFLQPGINHLEKEKNEFNKTYQTESVNRNYIDSGKEKVRNAHYEKVGKVCKDNELRLRPKHKKSCKKSCRSSKAKAKIDDNSKTSIPVLGIEKVVSDTTKTESLATLVNTPIAPADFKQKQHGTAPFTTSSISNGNIFVNQMASSKAGVANYALRLVVPQSTALNNAVKTTAAIKLGMQGHGMKTNELRQTDRFILPSGFVKDESTNQMFHTYHFNGQTFAMIDNKLYQINLKFSDGKRKTVIGALIPTISSTSPTSARPGFVKTEFTRNLTTACSRNTDLSANFIPGVVPSNTYVRSNAHLSQKPIAYRFPGNNIPSSAQSNQPLNLLIVPTSPSDAATHSTQVIRQPLMHAFGSNSTVRAHLQQTLGQTVYTSQSLVETQEIKRDTVRLPVTFMQTAGFQYGNYIRPSISVPQNLRKQQKSPIESNNVRPTSAFPNTMHQAISPRTAKSLLTNKTYVMVNTSPEEGAQFAVQSKRNLEYCGSVILSSASNSSLLTSQIKQNPPRFDKQMASPISQHAEITRVSALNTVASTKENNSRRGLNDLTKDNSVRIRTQDIVKETVSETTVVKPNVTKLQQNVSSQEDSKYVFRSISPAKICSSMDSCIYTAERKRKGTPLKKLFDENSSMPPKVQKMNESENCFQSKEIAIDNSVHNENVSDKETDKAVNEKITEPVPFLDYPARIVTTSKSGCSKKLMEIVASPNCTVKSGQNSDTSLDDEKIAKMINFANLLEEESNEKDAGNKKLKRKNLLKKRRIGENGLVEDRGGKRISATDSEDESEEKSINGMENEKEGEEENIKNNIDLKETEPKQPENKLDFPAVSLEHAVNFVEKIEKSVEYKDRNMFDDLEQFVPKQSSMSESCNESSASYDSSDLETYEKFVSNRKTSDIMKPKSQFIESYYTSQGMKELKRRNMEPTYKVPITDSIVTSERSPKVLDLESVSSKSSLKEVEMDFDDSNQGDETIPVQRTSHCSKSCSNIADIRQDIGPVVVKNCSKEDMAVNSIKDDTGSLSEINLKTSTVSGKQVKKLIKTKFIILKGEICDRWFDIKRRTGFGELSDPKFIHYLLWSEEEKHRKKTQSYEVSVQTVECSTFNKERSKETSNDSSEVDSGDYNHVDLRNNNYADRFSDDKTAVSDEDFEATIVNVTDTPPNSPMLSDVSSPVCGTLQNNIFFQSPKFPETGSMISSNEKQSDGKSEIPHGAMASTFDKAMLLPDCLDHSRKRQNKEMDFKDQPTAKKHYPILSCATQRQMQWAVSLFREWLKEKGEENTQFECMDSAWLNDRLAKFYTDALSHEGTPYSTNILQTFRRALSLYLTSNCSSQNVRISISQDLEYTRSNEILKELVFAETLQNNVSVADNVSYPITDDDLKKLYTTRTLSDDDPTSLMFKVWFDITYYLCKGNLPKNFWRSLTKRSLVLDSDVNGVFYSFADYVYIPPDEEPGKMYATPSEPEKCPVRSTSFYLSKLCANCEALFQCSKRSWHKLQERWYLPVPVSREKLDKIMSRISEQAQLSRVYDSSCVILTAKLKGVGKE